MIAGIGVDVVPFDRVRRMVDRYGPRFLDRVFTAVEKRHCLENADPVPNLAGRIAAKEAAIKALGVPDGLRWTDMEIAAIGRAPKLRLDGVALRRASEMGVLALHVSITHAGGVAVAVVVLER